ncbi:MAG: hypothetical protein HY033_03420 [Ignavibacteriae bacterium]|nr:hypothetical protein [Ignavibacteria bacterium]MBI3363939.1 hypothetical protein [Ignavibacteriota bacterium]
MIMPRYTCCLVIIVSLILLCSGSAFAWQFQGGWLKTTDYIPPGIDTGRVVQVFSPPVLVPSPTPFKNIILFPSPNPVTHQTEISIEADPSNSNNLLSGANAIRPRSYPFPTIGREGYYYSLNQGLNWTGGDSLRSEYSGGDSDPSVAYDHNGNPYFSSLYISGWGYLSVRKSTDHGQTWGENPFMADAIHADKEHLIVDVNSTSPYRDSIYVGWTDFTYADASDTVRINPVRFAKSVDGAASFPYPWKNISGTSGYYVAQGVCLSTGPSGELYATWVYVGHYSLNPVDDSLGFNKSLDGG